MTINLEKAFDSLDHDFLLHILKMFGLGDNFINLIKALLNDQQPCVINGGFTTQYLTFEGDPISVYLFITGLEVLFALIKNKVDIKDIVLCNHSFYSLPTQVTLFSSSKTFLQLKF